MLIEISIPKWADYNPRSDRANYSWFRFQNEFFTDQKLFGLTDTQLMLFVFCLCEASKKSNQDVILNLDFVSAVRKIPADKVLKDLRELAKRGVLVASERRPKDVSLPEQLPATNERDERNETNDTVTAAPKAPPPVDKALVKEIWKAYSDSFFNRYRTEPVRNAKVNAQVGQLAKRLGQEAVDVVRFYLAHNKAFYVSKTHEFGLCLSDAESLRTQWATNTKVTATAANQADQSDSLREQLKRLGGEK